MLTRYKNCRHFIGMFLVTLASIGCGTYSNEGAHGDTKRLPIEWGTLSESGRSIGNGCPNISGRYENDALGAISNPPLKRGFPQKMILSYLLLQLGMDVRVDLIKINTGTNETLIFSAMLFDTDEAIKTMSVSTKQFSCKDGMVELNVKSMHGGEMYSEKDTQVLTIGKLSDGDLVVHEALNARVSVFGLIPYTENLYYWHRFKKIEGE
jgi:hypothetical protein